MTEVRTEALILREHGKGCGQMRRSRAGGAGQQRHGYRGKAAGQEG